MATKARSSSAKSKKAVKVRDLKPRKDAKAGGVSTAITIKRAR